AFGTSYVPETGEYDWGSNSAVVNTQVVLAVAFDLTGDVRFRDAVLEAMDYLLGRNALNYSYVTGYGEAFSKNQHSRWFANQLEPSLPNPPPGSLAGGPNSLTGTWDPTMQSTFTQGCAPSMCYLDHIQSWASNEITVNWNAALSQLASFVADQGDGTLPEAPSSAPVVTKHPVSKSAKLGSTVVLTAAASGVPAPSVTWQVRPKGGTWRTIAGATSTTLKVAVKASGHKSRYRAVFSSSAGKAKTDAAQILVKRAKPRFTKQPSSVKAKVGTLVKLKVATTGFPVPKIQWQVRTPGGKWRTIKGATRKTLSVKVTAAKHQNRYRAVARSSAGSATSSVAR